MAFRFGTRQATQKRSTLGFLLVLSLLVSVVSATVSSTPAGAEPILRYELVSQKAWKDGKVVYYPYLIGVGADGPETRMWAGHCDLGEAREVSWDEIRGTRQLDTNSDCSVLESWLNASPVNPPPPNSGARFGAVSAPENTVDCDVTIGAGQSIQAAIDEAGRVAQLAVRAGRVAPTQVLCVSGSSIGNSPRRFDESLTISVPNLKLHAVGLVQVNSVVLQDTSNVELNGFRVVSEAAGAGPEYFGITLDRVTDSQVEGNVVQGHAFRAGIGCANRIVCDGNRIAHNTISEVENYGVKLSGRNNQVEFNDISALRRTWSKEDVDGIRFFGEGQVINNNYIHDLYQQDSVSYKNGNGQLEPPHVDCFQTVVKYETYNPEMDPIPTSARIENNYCVRVSRQCLIVENNSPERVIRSINFRNNVCDMLSDHQAINLKSTTLVRIENNLIINRNEQFHVILFAQLAGNPATRSTYINNNVLVKATDAVNFISRSGAHSDDQEERNVEVVGLGGLPGASPTAQLAAYRGFVEGLVEAGLPIVDQSLDARGGFTARDIDGTKRKVGSRVDVGPFEFR